MIGVKDVTSSSRETTPSTAKEELGHLQVFPSWFNLQPPHLLPVELPEPSLTQDKRSLEPTTHGRDQRSQLLPVSNEAPS